MLEWARRRGETCERDVSLDSRKRCLSPSESALSLFRLLPRALNHVLRSRDTNLANSSASPGSEYRGGSLRLSGRSSTPPNVSREHSRKAFLSRSKYDTLERAMSFSPFSLVFEPCHDSGNVVLAPETACAAGRGGGRPGFSVPKPPFTRSTSYNSEFSSSTCGSLTDASSPPASSPSLGGLDSPTFGRDDDFVRSTSA